MRHGGGASGHFRLTKPSVHDADPHAEMRGTTRIASYRPVMPWRALHDRAVASPSG